MNQLAMPLKAAVRHALAVPRGAGHGPWQQGCTLAAQHDWPAAAQAFARATRASPHDPLYWVNLANAERHVGAYPRAEAAAHRALALDAGHALALQVLGDSLVQMHRYAEAVAVFAQLEQGGTEAPEALLQHAQMLQALQRQAEAVPVLLKALSLQPHMVYGHALLADALRDLGHKREAVACMHTVLALDPGNLEAMSHLSFEKRHTCDWSDFDSELQRMQDDLEMAPEGLARIAATFGLLSLPLDPLLHLVAARGETQALTWRTQALPPVLPAVLPVSRKAARGDRRLRIGWVSYDFREHPVSQLIVELLEGLDREQFEVLLYSSGPDDASPLRQRIAQAADKFTDIRGLSDQQAATQVRADGVDMLVDLMGHTRGHRLGLFAWRAAPLQVAFLGYPGSTGAGFIDYLIADPLVTPLELAPLYSEKLAQLPRCFQPNGRGRPLPQAWPQKTGRAAVGLPEDAFVMCAFNHTYKILPQAFDAWCAVLRDVPQAVLWLKQTNAQLHDNVRAEALARGIDPARVLFAPRTSYAEYFSRLALADVFVDTWPYNAHTTAADALWAGLPVVTVYGNSFASRVAASVLDAAGLAELAFANAQDYRCAITALAQEPALLAGYRQHLQLQRYALPLFDAAGYTRDFERLLLRMFGRWQAGLAAEHLPAEDAPAEPPPAEQPPAKHLLALL